MLPEAPESGPLPLVVFQDGDTTFWRGGVAGGSWNVARTVSPRIEALELDDYKGANLLKQIANTFECWLARAPFEVEDLKAST